MFFYNHFMFLSLNYNILYFVLCDSTVVVVIITLHIFHYFFTCFIYMFYLHSPIELVFVRICNPILQLCI